MVLALWREPLIYVILSTRKRSDDVLSSPYWSKPVMNPYEHILVTVDFSRISQALVTRANELARLYQARISLLHVLEDMSLGNVAFGGTSTLPMSPAIKQNQINLATDKLKQLANSLGVPANAALEVITGKSSDVIAQFVKQKGVDLVVVGNSGRKGLMGFLGSTAEATIKNVPCDVLTIHI
jgi:universal stress protein A